MLGLLRQPKYGHLKQLHTAIKSCSTTLLQGVQRNFSLGQLQEVGALKFVSPAGLFKPTIIQTFLKLFHVLIRVMSLKKKKEDVLHSL